MLESKLIIIPALGLQNKGKSSFTGSGLFVLMSQCGNNNEFAVQHGGFCTTWSLAAKGLLINVTFCLFYLNLKVEVRCFYWWDEISLALHTLLQLLLAAWDNPSWRAPVHPCHKAAILPRGTKNALFYHAKPHPHGFHCEAYRGKTKLFWSSVTIWPPCDKGELRSPWAGEERKEEKP